MRRPSVTRDQRRRSNLPSFTARSPAIPEEMRVMIRTAAREAMSQRETKSSFCHSSLVGRGISLSALPHIATFFMILASPGIVLKAVIHSDPARRSEEGYAVALRLSNLLAA